MRAFAIRRTEVSAEDGIPEDREGIVLITQRVAENVRIFSLCFLAVVFCFIDLGAG